MPIKAKFPDIRPSLNLDFARSKTVDPRIAFTRASTATQVNRLGFVETVPANVPRIDYDPVTLECKGLLIEEQRTNLLTYSEQMDNSAWVKVSGAVVDANVAADPQGSTTAEKFSVGTSTFPQITQAVTTSVSTAHTGVVYFKAAGLDFVQLRVRDTGAQANFFLTIPNLTNGTVTQNLAGGNGTLANVTVQNAGNGWWRVGITGVANTSGTSLQVVVILTKDSSGTVATPTNSAATDGIYIWGAQLEAGSFPTSYIPTTTAAATRATDVAVMTGANFSSWYRQDEGTLFAEVSTPSEIPKNRFPQVFYISDGTVENSMRIAYNTESIASFSSRVNNTFQADLNTTATGRLRKIAGAYKLDNFALCTNGGNIQSDTTGTIPYVDRATLGNSVTLLSSGALAGHIRRIAYYPARIPSDQLQALTA